MKKRVVILFVVMSMVLTACSGTGGKTGSTDTAATPGASSQATQAAADAVTSLTYCKMVDSTSAAAMPEGQTPEDNDFVDYLRDQYKLDCKMAWSAEYADYANKLALNMASGNLPDIIFVSDYYTFRQMVDNGIAADITDAYAATASDLMKQYDASYDNKNLDAVTVDGKLYALPAGNYGFQQDVLWVRKDWLDKLGMQVPVTIDDLEKTFRAFTFDDPDGDGVDDTIGLTISPLTPVKGFANLCGLEPIFASFNVYPRQWLQDENGKVYNGTTDPEIKEPLALLAGWYKEGIIDTQFATRLGTDETRSTILDGTSGAYFGPWWFFPTDMYSNSPDAEWVAVNCPVDKDGKYNYITDKPVQSMIVINKNCKNIEAAIKTIAVSLDCVRGIDEKGYKILDDLKGGPNPVPFGIGWTSDFYDIVPKLGKAVADNIEKGSYEPYVGMTAYDKQQVEYAKAWLDGTTRNDASMWAYYARYIGGSIVDADNCNPVNPCYTYTTESSSSLQPSIDKLEDEMYLQIIIGEKPVDYYDDFISQWHKIGGDTLTEEVQALMN